MPIFLLIAGIIIWPFVQQALGLSKLKFQFKKIDGVSFSGINPVIRPVFLVSNPSNARYNVQSLQANLFYNDKYLGFATVDPFTLNAGETIEMMLSFKVDAISAGSAVVQLIKNGVENRNLRVQGQVTIDGNQFPINETLAS